MGLNFKFKFYHPLYNLKNELINKIILLSLFLTIVSKHAKNHIAFKTNKYKVLNQKFSMENKHLC